MTPPPAARRTGEGRFGARRHQLCGGERSGWPRNGIEESRRAQLPATCHLLACKVGEEAVARSERSLKSRHGQRGILDFSTGS